MTTRDLRPGAVGLTPLPAQRPDAAHTFAVVVGIDRYPGYGDLDGACNDARAFAAWLVDPAGGAVPNANVRLHLSGTARSVRDAAPLKHQIDRDLEELVAAAAATEAPSRLYLYFAGHGIVPAGSAGAGVMANAVPEQCWNLSFSTYLTWFQRCREFAEVVMLSDCCRGLSEAAAGAPMHDVCRGSGRSGQARLVAHATDVGGLAFESTEPGGEVRGYFTAALVEALRGAALDPASGEITAATLAAHLARDVPVRSGGRQYPAIDMSFPPLTLCHGPVTTAGAPDPRAGAVGGAS